MASLARLALLVSLAALVGCHESSYVVARDGEPLYGSPTGTDVVARLPRYHHEALDEDPVDEAAPSRWRLEYRGQRGWASRAGVRVFEYLSPEWDEGVARDAAVRRELREVQLAEVGRDWSPRTLEAVRNDEVFVGMTRDQVELSWGWPTTVESGPRPGEERWVWRAPRTRTVRQYSPWMGWGGYYGGGFGGWGYYGYGGGYGPYGWRDDGWAWRSTWVNVSVPVTEEKIVEFDASGRAVRLDERDIIE